MSAIQIHYLIYKSAIQYIIWFICQLYKFIIWFICQLYNTLFDLYVSYTVYYLIY